MNFTIEAAKKILCEADVFYEDCNNEKYTLNMNDVWGWAVAWGEEVKKEELPEVAELFYKYGNCGLFYWVSKKNNNMRSEFYDINRYIDFVRNEEQLIEKEPDYNKRAYMKIKYKIG